MIAEKLTEEAAELAGEVEVDDSYFGGRRKGKRGHGAAGKVPVFGLLKSGGRVYTMAVKDTKADTLIPIITCKIKPDSIVYTDRYRSYDRQNHINGIENFWNQAKIHLRKYNGVPHQNFQLFLKECEWRFNYARPTSP